MSDDGSKQNGKPRGRRRSTGLRKHQPVDGVVVQETFPLYDESTNEKAGEGLYVSATTASNRRYYGVLVDQQALRVASTMYFKDQSDSLKLTERMKLLFDQPAPAVDCSSCPNNESTDAKPSHGHGAQSSFRRCSEAMEEDDQDQQVVTMQPKKARMDTSSPAAENPSESHTTIAPNGSEAEKPVQKLKYVGGVAKEAGHRILVATFSSVDEAGCGDKVKINAIRAACEGGGNFLDGIHKDSYYYQYEVLPSSLMTNHNAKSVLDLRTSMGFHTFLQNTHLPGWFPLSSLHSQHKVLSMMNMKRDNNGNVTWEGSARIREDAKKDLVWDTQVPMQPRERKAYHIGVIGGGIAGLMCCQELITLLDNEGIDAKVTLLEARPRLGGRLLTDRSWKTDSNKEFPIELGASWIHGINDNPLASLATVAGIQFATASEDVKMLGKDMHEVNGDTDENMGKLFDKLLDHAAEDCWKTREDTSLPHGKVDPQAVARFYGSAFLDDASQDNNVKKEMSAKPPIISGPPPHRRSNDRSIDMEIGKAIAQYHLQDFAKLTEEEKNILLWYIKNVEYAMNSNISSMSSKYWDVDDRHAFEGEHVLLKQGYSSVIDHIVQGLKSKGRDKFEMVLDFRAGNVEYGRKSASEPFGKDSFGRGRKLVELSDTCSVTSVDGGSTKFFDFIVCAIPLGVLKECICSGTSNKQPQFIPRLPFAKEDCISAVGFGLLNKVWIRFQEPFWRTQGFFQNDDDCLFGNVSGVNPHHYMFFDAGRRLGDKDDAPAILMSLVSGKEAVDLEFKSDKEVTEEIMETLHALFSPSIVVPEPIAVKITRWGSDPYSRGSYSFLTPGSTDQDYQMLQSPVCAHGDSLLLEGDETMRLFFAGEHTSALHPSTAHGAMLSGVRAAQEVVATIQNKNNEDKDIDKVIPTTIFRYLNPSTPLRCQLCHKSGGQIREGALLAFKRGPRQVLAHNNCAEMCPEVEVVNAKWKHVISAVNRGKNFNCEQCLLTGAAIGCAFDDCSRNYHVACAEDCGWRFDRDGKHFFCDLHRKVHAHGGGCDRISLQFFRYKNPGKSAACALCTSDEESVAGEILAFQFGTNQTCAHLNCLKYTTVVDTTEIAESRMGKEFQNVFEALEASKECFACSKGGATIGCSSAECGAFFHYPCALKSGWNFDRKGKRFACSLHRIKVPKHDARKNHSVGVSNATDTNAPRNDAFLFQHNLLTRFGATVKGYREDIPGNLDIGDAVAPDGDQAASLEKTMDVESDSDDSLPGEEDGVEVMDIILSSDVSGPKQLVRIERPSREEFWNLSLQFARVKGLNVISIASAPTEADLFSVQKGDVLVSINGTKIGSPGLLTLRDVLKRMSMEVDLMLQVVRN
jgi:lysine-specific histone demethylase 1